MRGADAGLWNNLCALPALWVGLLYNNDVMTAVYDVISDFTNEDVLKMRDDVPIQGLATATPKGSMLDLAKIILPLAKQGFEKPREDWCKWRRRIEVFICLGRYC